jgi:hypothetical protein
MKICSTCNIGKPLDEFYVRKTGKPLASCKVCVREKFRKTYEANREKYAEKNKRSWPKYRERNFAYMLDHLKNNPCVDCGETDVEVLEFDHVVPLQGQRVTNMNTCSLRRLQEEIDKCEIRCANCHTRRTRKQMGWTGRQ